MTDGGRGRRAYLMALGSTIAVGLTGCTDDTGDGDPTQTDEPTTGENPDGQVSSRWPSYVDDATDRGYEDHRGEDEVTITVENNGFDPTFLSVDPGTTIAWTFGDPGHDLNFESQPADASVSGTPGGTADTVEEGATHSVTPDVIGVYTYYCWSHEGLGMKGAFAVSDQS